MASTSRRWDKEPESEKDTRFFDLRDSGFRGPIDQDGYAQTPEQHQAWLDTHRNGH